MTVDSTIQSQHEDFVGFALGKQFRGGLIWTIRNVRIINPGEAIWKPSRGPRAPGHLWGGTGLEIWKPGEAHKCDNSFRRPSRIILLSLLRSYLQFVFPPPRRARISIRLGLQFPYPKVWGPLSGSNGPPVAAAIAGCGQTTNSFDLAEADWVRISLATFAVASGTLHHAPGIRSSHVSSAAGERPARASPKLPHGFVRVLLLRPDHTLAAAPPVTSSAVETEDAGGTVLCSFWNCATILYLLYLF